METERLILEKKYRPLFLEKPEFRQLVTYVPNKKEPVYGWFKYKEAFSRLLIEKISSHWQLPKKAIIFDPFAGCGTTLLAGKDLGYKAIGIDIFPVSIFTTKAKLSSIKISDTHILDSYIKELFNKKFHPPKSSFPNLRIIDLAFQRDTQAELMFFKEQIEHFPEPYRGFFLLGLLSILEDVSYTSKDGQFLRLVKKKIPSVSVKLKEKLNRMVDDLAFRNNIGLNGGGSAEIKYADARDFRLPKKYHGKINAVITSPPYLNRYDYSRSYALELCMLFVKDFDAMRTIRHSLLRSHIESKEHEGKDIKLRALDEILENLSHKALNNKRIPIMVKAYFEDMNLVLKNLYDCMAYGSQVALVVANARFEGEMIPVDLMLSELSELHGFKTESIWITRYKGNSSQQMAKYGKVPARESIVFWRKNRG